MITATGLGSGLDINGLVSQLVAAERAGSDIQLDRQNAKFTSKFSALGTLKGSLSTFQGLVGTVNTLANFSKNTVSSSASSELSATADSTAIANSYSIDVTQRAVSHSLASAAFADSDTTALGTGTMTIRFGTTDYTSGTDTYNSFVLNPDSSTATITCKNHFPPLDIRFCNRSSNLCDELSSGSLITQAGELLFHPTIL